MRKWEKPVLSVLGVDETKGGSIFKVLSGVPSLDKDDNFVETEDYDGGDLNLECHCPSWCTKPKPHHHH